MSTLILTQQEVRRLLPMRRCIELMGAALRTLGRGEALNPLRQIMPLRNGNSLLGLMPGQLDEPRALGLKIVGVFPDNHGTEYDSHQGLVALFDTDTGAPLAIMDGSEITAIRTAAVSGVATQQLARDEAGDLAILGSGVQARTHLEAMLIAREIRRVRVYSPTLRHRHAFAERESERHGIRIEAAETARDAVLGADLICTVSSSSEPILHGDWIAPGTHINAAGASTPTARELDTAAVVRSRLFVDRRESAIHEAGDFLIPRDEGALDEGHIVAELGELLLGHRPGRESAEEITLFKSLGLAVEDLAAAYHVHACATEEDVGISVDLGGQSDAAD